MNKVRKVDKSEVLSWRLSRELKAALEAAGNDEGVSIDTILERLVREWLAGRVWGRQDEQSQTHSGLMESPSRYKGPRKSMSRRDDAEQRRLRAQLLKAAGTVSVGGPSATNAEVRKVMGEYLEAKYRASQRRAPRRPR